MATYALTFATRAAFDTSLASGDIYNLMQGVTSSKPSVAITATITESGETFACGTNVMIDIKSVGPGDRVMYESSSEDDPTNEVYKGRFFGIASKWIDNNAPFQPTQHIMIYKQGVLPSRYVDCGVCVKRFGNRIRLAGATLASPWSTTGTSGYEWDVATVPHDDAIQKKNRLISNGFTTRMVSMPSNRVQEAVFYAGAAAYFPIRRSTWNAAVVAGASTVTENGKTANMADYDYDYDKFLNTEFCPLWPASEGVFRHNDGKSYTRLIVADFIANHGKAETSVDYAAGYCYNYSVNAPGLRKKNWFFGSIKDVSDIGRISYTLPVPAAWGGGSIFWSSNQVYAASAWVLFTGALTFNYNKNNSFAVVPLADLIIEN